MDQENNYLSLWKITNPTTNPTLQRIANLNIQTYKPPVKAEQHGQYKLYVNSSAAISNVIVRDGYLYCAFTTAYNWGGMDVDAIRYLKIDITNNTVVWDGTYGQNNIYYTYPVIQVDSYGNVLMAFNKSSSDSFLGVYYNYRNKFKNYFDLENEKILKIGEGDIIKEEVSNSNNSLYKPIAAYEVRIGDYNGIALDPIEESTFWFCGEYGRSDHKWGIYIGSYSFIPVRFVNDINDNNAGGELLVNNAIQISSGDKIALENNSNNVVKTLNWKFLNFASDGLNYQHNNWNNDHSEYKLTHSFRVNDDSMSQKAKFIPLENTISVNNFLSGSSSVDSSIIEFKDPWLLEDGMQSDTLKIYNAPFTPGQGNYTDYTGVFLNQGYKNGVWNQPYYEVKAEAQQPFTAHNETITGYFLNWEGHDVSYQNADQLQTPVAFHTANAEARAVYKGHLCSDVQNATATNNARKFAKTDDGKLHWVYVDDQSVFYTYSTDNGQTWAKEICLARKDDDAQVYFIAPSIAKYGNEIYVAYIEVYPGSGFSDIWEQHINYGAQNPQWSTRLGVNTIYTEDSTAVTSATFIQRDDGSGTVFPLIAVGYTMDNEKYLEVYKKENGEYSSVLNLTNCSYPSLSADTYHSVNSQQIALAYESQDQIFLRTAYWDNGVLTWSGEEQVSNDDDTYSDQSHPNVSAMNGYCHVVWSAYNTEDQKNEVLYRMYMPGSSGNTISSAAPPGNLVPYGTVTEIKSSNYSVYNPSVTALEDQTAYIFYEKNGGIYRKHFVNQNYYGYSYFGTGHYPSVCDHVSQGAGWMHYDDAPFILRTDVNGPSNAIPIEPINPNWGAINMKLSADANGGQEGHIIIRFYDFTYGQDTLQMNQALRTDSMDISGDNVPLTMNLEVVFKNVINRPADDDLIYTLNFVDNGDTINLTPLKYGDLPNNPSPNGERFFKLTTIVNLGNRGGKFVMKLADSSALVYRIIKTDESQSNPKVKSPSQVIPKTFALHQNFPNPFNPITHITVDLPEDAKVHLSVYNVNGQKVKELMSGYKAAGTYEIIFDGKNLASGVYIYRLTTDKGFVQSKKMMLIR